MAETNQGAGQSGGKGKDSAIRIQQRAVSRAAKTGGYVMDGDERYNLQIVRNANRACKLVSERIQSGKPVSPEVLAACAQLSAAFSGVTFQ